jgi:hypothetical protein
LGERAVPVSWVILSNRFFPLLPFFPVNSHHQEIMIIALDLAAILKAAFFKTLLCPDIPG